MRQLQRQTDVSRKTMMSARIVSWKLQTLLRAGQPTSTGARRRHVVHAVYTAAVSISVLRCTCCMELFGCGPGPYNRAQRVYCDTTNNALTWCWATVRRGILACVLGLSVRASTAVTGRQSTRMLQDNQDGHG